MTDDKNEREHCVATVTAMDDAHDDYVSVLLSERAAARAQGEAQGYERGRKDAVAAIEAVLDECGQTEGADELYVYEYVVREALRKLQS